MGQPLPLRGARFFCLKDKGNLLAIYQQSDTQIDILIIVPVPERRNSLTEENEDRRISKITLAGFQIQRNFNEFVDPTNASDY